jgi:hypothetical protein
VKGEIVNEFKSACPFDHEQARGCPKKKEGLSGDWGCQWWNEHQQHCAIEDIAESLSALCGCLRDNKGTCFDVHIVGP